MDCYADEFQLVHNACILLKIKQLETVDTVKVKPISISWSASSKVQTANSKQFYLYLYALHHLQKKNILYCMWVYIFMFTGLRRIIFYY